jgi:hypothetical protein
MASNKEFLTEKLNNYKKFLRDNSNSPDKCDELDKFTLEQFLIFGAATLMPLMKSGGLGIAIDKTVEKFDIKSDEEVHKKIGRYYEFLVAFLESTKESYLKEKSQ